MFTTVILSPTFNLRFWGSNGIRPCSDAPLGTVNFTFAFALEASLLELGKGISDLEFGASFEVVKFTDGVNATEGFDKVVTANVRLNTKEEINKNKVRPLKIFKNSQVRTDN
jgi:hypothetical protein